MDEYHPLDRHPFLRRTPVLCRLAGEAPVLLTTVSITRMAWTWFGIVTYASRTTFGRMRGVRGPWTNAIGRHAVAGR